MTKPVATAARNNLARTREETLETNQTLNHVSAEAGVDWLQHWCWIAAHEAQQLLCMYDQTAYFSHCFLLPERSSRAPPLTKTKPISSRLNCEIWHRQFPVACVNGGTADNVWTWFSEYCLKFIKQKQKKNDQLTMLFFLPDISSRTILPKGLISFPELVTSCLTLVSAAKPRTPLYLKC